MKLYAGRASDGAKALSEALNIKRIKSQGSRYVARQGDVVLNWGSSRLPASLARARIINPPEGIQLVSNKLSFFERVKEERINDNPIIPPFTTDRATALDYLRDGGLVVCRTTLSGSGGDGIVLATNEREIVPAPLYTKYIPKKHEYRIHVAQWDTNEGAQQEVIDRQQKARRNDVAEPNWRIRNHANGFIYKRQDITVPEIVDRVALLAMAFVYPLNYGAVDIIYNSDQRRAYVLEINSAPGLEGQTVQSYAEHIRRVWM